MIDIYDECLSNGNPKACGSVDEVQKQLLVQNIINALTHNNTKKQVTLHWSTTTSVNVILAFSRLTFLVQIALKPKGHFFVFCKFLFYFPLPLLNKIQLNSQNRQKFKHKNEK